MLSFILAHACCILLPETRCECSRHPLWISRAPRLDRPQVMLGAVGAMVSGGLGMPHATGTQPALPLLCTPPLVQPEASGTQVVGAAGLSRL
jgi:hypothetical protein